MKGEYLSGSSLREHRLKKFFLVPFLVWILYALISLTMLSLINIVAVWRFLLGEPIAVSDIVLLTDRFSAFQDRLGTPVVMAFWLFIGAITYTIIWLLENVVFIAKTEVEESQYVYGSSGLQKRFLESTITSNLFLIFVALVWVSFIAVYLRLLLPLSSQLFHNGLSGGPLYQRFLEVTAAIIGNMLAIYVFLLLRRILTYLWRANRPVSSV